MASEPHLALREYIENIRLSIGQVDAFGQFLLRLIYRENRVSGSGLFHRVKEVNDAVIAAGGTAADARAWTAQAVRWWREGKAVEQKYARFEIDLRAIQAMDALLKMLQALPES